MVYFPAAKRLNNYLCILYYELCIHNIVQRHKLTPSALRGQKMLQNITPPDLMHT